YRALPGPASQFQPDQRSSSRRAAFGSSFRSPDHLRLYPLAVGAGTGRTPGQPLSRGGAKRRREAASLDVATSGRERAASGGSGRGGDEGRPRFCGLRPERRDGVAPPEIDRSGGRRSGAAAASAKAARIKAGGYQSLQARG